MKRFRKLIIIGLLLAFAGIAYGASTWTSPLHLQKAGRGTANWDTITNNNWQRIANAWSDFQNALTDLPEVYQLPGTFNGTAGVVIALPKTVGATDDYTVNIQPSSYGGTDIADIKVVNGLSSFTVYSEGNNAVDTFIATVHYESDLATYGNQVFRRWIVSPDAAITDHTDASAVGSLAYILTAISGATSEIVFPASHTYVLGWGKSYTSMALGAIFDDATKTLIKAGETFQTKGFAAGMPIHISGSTSNDGYYRIDSVDSETQITLIEEPVDETTAGAVVVQLAIPSYVKLTFDKGAILDDDSTGYDLWMYYVPDATPVQIFSWTGDLHFSYGANRPIYTEWAGALADGDGVTDDSGPMNQIFDAAPMGGRIILGSDSTNGYYIGTTMLDIDDVTSRRLTVEGEATIFSATTGTAFRVMSRSTTLKDFTLQASSGAERNDPAQVGLLLMNQTGGMYDHISVKDFYTNFKLYVESAGQAPTYFETSKFFALYSSNGHYGFHISTDKTSWQSFATLHFYGCAADIASTETDGVGVYIGPNVDLYRGYMDISVHPKATNSRGFEYHGRTTAFTGRWMGECHAGQYPLNTGQTGIYIANDANRLQGLIETDWMACPNPYERQADSPPNYTPVPTGMYTMDNKGTSHLVWTGEVTTPFSFADAGFYTIKTHAVSSMTAGATTTVTTSVAHELNPGDRAIINGLNAGPAGTPTACAFTISDDRVTDAAHGLVNGNRIEFTAVGATTGITTGRVYFVVNKDTDWFKVSLTYGGAAIDLATSDGSGTYISPPAKNPFHDLFEWESVEVLTAPTTTSFTIRVDSTSVVDPWPTGDSASLRGGNVKFQMNISALDYVQFLSPGGRFSYLQSNDDSYNQNVALIPILTCKSADMIAADQDGDTTAQIDVSGVACLELDYDDPATVITKFLGTTFGNPMNRMLRVIHVNSNTGIKYGDGASEIHTLGQQDVVGQAGMIQDFWISDSLDPGVFQWWEVSRAYNNHIKNVWASVPAAPQVGQQFLCTDCLCGGAAQTYPIVWDGTNWLCGNGDTSPNT